MQCKFPSPAPEPLIGGRVYVCVCVCVCVCKAPQVILMISQVWEPEVFIDKGRKTALLASSLAFCFGLVPSARSSPGPASPDPWSGGLIFPSASDGREPASPNFLLLHHEWLLLWSGGPQASLLESTITLPALVNAPWARAGQPSQVKEGAPDSPLQNDEL